MVNKEELHLGQRVWFGAERQEAVVDGLTWDWAGLRMVDSDGGYVIAEYGDVYLEGE
jgi:hypothetical protein